MESKIKKCAALKTYLIDGVYFKKGKEYEVAGETKLSYDVIGGNNKICMILKKDFYKLFSVYHPEYSHELKKVATKFEKELHNTMGFIEDLLLFKNKKYGDAALNPQRVFSKSDTIEQLNVRIDDKLSRIKNRQNDEDEDVELDLIGYLILKRIANKHKK